ncbi:MAG TPA: YciI family protein [Streptosporangiaceae bacterium]|nr:YciI family protein [Streptosporangiaceae bacterium]
MKFLCYTLGDPSAQLPPPSPDIYERMDAFMAEAVKAGVLLATGGVASFDEAIRVRYRDGEYSVLDGPFTEAKELVGGWALMECRDKAEIVEWTKRFLDIAGPGEVTIREVLGG